MQANSSQRSPILFPLAAFAFAAAHLGFEHFTGGVQSHHFLNRPDLPAISNWLGLITLPLLGLALGLRVRSRGMPFSVLAALIGAFLYGAMLAASFELGAPTITSTMFIGLFVLALALPVYRVEYVTGFVIGMTVTFGAILPLIVAGVVAVLSFLVRYSFRTIAHFVRTRRAS